MKSDVFNPESGEKYSSSGTRKIGYTIQFMRFDITTMRFNQIKSPYNPNMDKHGGNYTINMVATQKRPTSILGVLKRL